VHNYIDNRNTWPGLTPNADGIFNRFVTVFANRARHTSWELPLGRESMQLSSNVQSNYGGYPSKHIQ
jgi:hypothetical protein